MKVYILRHAKSLSHEQSKRQIPDSPLGSVGKRQAKKIGERIAKEKINIIFSSPWLRARQTALIISRKLKIPIEYMADIVEITHSAQLLNHEYDNQLYQRFEKERVVNISNLDWKFDDSGESKRDLTIRAYRFQKHLLTKHLGQNILVVTHGIFLKAFIASCILDEKCHDDKSFASILQVLRSENTGLTLLEYIEESKVWKINYLNDHSHLNCFT